MSSTGLAQLHIAETEKYAHITFFLNGTVEDPFKGEERTIIPSPRVATYDTKALEIEVGVLSSSGRRYLEVLGKLDQLMPLLQTLEIHEVITTREVDKQRALVKRQVRGVATAARNFASGLRRRMNAPDEGVVVAGDLADEAPAEAADVLPLERASDAGLSAVVPADETGEPGQAEIEEGVAPRIATA